MNGSGTNQLPGVEWRPLVKLTPWEVIWELVLPLPWLGLSLWCYGAGAWHFGLPASFFFFLTGLRQSHNAQHYSLGVDRRLQDGVLCWLSVWMLASMHAVQVTHLHHHRYCLGDGDVEGSTAKMKWWRALLAGPWFSIRLHAQALRLASKEKRRWIAVEVALIAIWIALVWRAFGLPALQWHIAAMLAGECLAGFFAVWTVHHDCDSIARTQRGRLVNFLSYSMFFHAEHHLFPAVPTCHLARLARALDEIEPELREWQVLVWPKSTLDRVGIETNGAFGRRKEP